MTHTPGPWTTTGEYANGFGVAIHSDDGHVADAKGVMCVRTVKANARLIAAAPDLLAALKGLYEVVGNVWFDADQLAAIDAAMVTARATIAKAEGSE